MCLPAGVSSWVPYATWRWFVTMGEKPGGVWAVAMRACKHTRRILEAIMMVWGWFGREAIAIGIAIGVEIRTAN
jgi:hypothetical protein